MTTNSVSISKIPAYPVAASRNVFQNELSYILDYVWQTLN